MKANVIQVFPFNIDKIKLLTLRGPKGETGYPTPEQVQAAVDAWLEDHPEATTTVQDGAITTPKLADEAVTVDKLSESLQSLLITDTASGSIASFTDGSDGIPVRDLKVSVEPKQSGSGDPSPSNIRPITGWTEAKVTREPWNLMPSPVAQTKTSGGVTFTCDGKGRYTVSGTASGDVQIFMDLPSSFVIPVSILNGGKGCMYLFNSVTNSKVSICFYNGNTQVDAWTFASVNRSTSLYGGQGGKTVNRICIRVNETTVNATLSPMFTNDGSTSSPFVENNGASITIAIPLGSTVYGGTLDVSTGVLTVDRAMVTLTAESQLGSFSTSSSGGYAGLSSTAGLLKIDNANAVAISSHGKGVSFNNRGSSSDFRVYGDGGGTLVVRGASGIDTKTKLFNAYNGATFVYYIATPTTVQLTPAQLNTLLGVNNIWSDAGDTSVEYYADTKLYIDLAGQTEDDMTANANIASGRYFQIGNTLYISTAAIAAGETIVPGTNCRKTTIAEALNALL